MDFLWNEADVERKEKKKGEKKLGNFNFGNAPVDYAE